MAIDRHSGARLLLLVLSVAGLAGLALAARPRKDSVPVLTPLPSISVPAPAASDLFVSTSGHDGSAGSASDPLASLQAAVDRVAPGSTVWVEPGRYQGFGLRRGGLSGAPITIAATTPGTAVITPFGVDSTIDLVGASHVDLINLVVEGPTSGMLSAVYLERSSAITIEGCTLRGTTGGFGVQVRFSSDVTIRDNDILHNAMGVRLYGEGDPSSVHDVLIEDNWIHDSDSMVVNDAAPNNDYGANGIVWHKVTGTTIARGNKLWANRAVSHDYGYDGGAFEIWGSSNAQIVSNVAWDNENVMETGSDGPDCTNISFLRNVAYAPSFGVGLILRCARDSLIANNVLDHLQSYAFELSDRSGGNQFATSIDGLRIENNIVVGSLAYAIRNALPATVVLDYNVLPPRRAIASFPNGVVSVSVAAFTRATGQDSHSIAVDPAFVAASAHDYRLRPGSPAIDRGTVVIPGETFLGAAPDIGAYEGAAALPSPSPAGSG
ncbi:MAG TPA: right-handed parallel beta-helix repeat-containing protein [Candidatus Dormibacteraeota bacterium]|nr:right-handed parallel beta-helix repeat-containing protein [Candidatus Dormibacteraeota bacterium]